MKRKTPKIKFELPYQFDWESPHFFKESFQILEESEQHTLFQEQTEAEQRSFSQELELWIEKWNLR